MAFITDKFFELIQISLGNKNGFEQPPSESEWGMLFQLSCKHSLAGILFEGFKKTKTIHHNSKPWITVLANK